MNTYDDNLITIRTAPEIKNAPFLPVRNYEEFLLIAYFGRNGSWLSRCCSRAYRDLSRTVWGIGQQKGLSLDVQSTLENRLSLIANKLTIDQRNFDEWHHDTCIEMIDAFKKGGYDRFTFGQAQKWINMALKYIFTVGPENLSGFDRCYEHCHAPLDNFLMAELVKDGFKRLNVPWSRLNDYARYLDSQKWIRETYNVPPLDTEYKLWLQYRED